MLKYGLYSKAACNQERLMMARVRYMNAQLAAEQTFVAFSEYVNFTQVGVRQASSTYSNMNENSNHHSVFLICTTKLTSKEWFVCYH